MSWRCLWAGLCCIVKPSACASAKLKLKRDDFSETKGVYNILKDGRIQGSREGDDLHSWKFFYSINPSFDYQMSCEQMIHNGVELFTKLQLISWHEQKNLKCLMTSFGVPWNSWNSTENVLKCTYFWRFYFYLNKRHDFTSFSKKRKIEGQRKFACKYPTDIATVNSTSKICFTTQFVTEEINYHCTRIHLWLC